MTVQRVVQLLLLGAKVIIPTGNYILTKTVCEGARAAKSQLHNGCRLECRSSPINDC